MSKSPGFVIRVLDADDASAFQRLRLLGLEESPGAFGASHSEEIDVAMSEIAARLKPDRDWSWVLGAFTANQELVGLLGFRRERGIKHVHKALLWGFYVAPAHRNHGVGRGLLEECIARARTIAGLNHVKLCVTSIQEAAIRLYVACGFRCYGRQPDALKIEGRFFDEDYMLLRLQKEG